MPLKRALSLVFLSATAALSAGPQDLGLSVNGYIGSGGVSVITPSMHGAAELDARTSLALKVDADAVSAASFNNAQSKTHRGSRPVGTCWTCHPPGDALSGATRNYLEMRRGAEIGVKRIQGPVDITVTYLGNQENDYSSHGASLGAVWNSEDANTAVGLGASALFDQIYPVTRAFNDELRTFGADLTFSRVLTARKLLKLGYSFAQAEGYMGSPYSFVQVADLKDFPTRTAVPRDKQRHVISLGATQGLWAGAALDHSARYYQDSWSVQSTTLGWSLAQRWGDWVFEPTLRWQNQPQGASFFKNHYAVHEPYMTRDLKLAPHSSWSWGLGVRGSVGGFDLEARWLRYQRFDNLSYALYFADGPELGDMLQLAVTLP